MENVVLTVHLILALALIGVVLMQRSEGGLGGLGGGGGGGGGLVSGRSAATALSKVTWGLAAAFLVTSLTLTILATRTTSTDSVIERLGADAPVSDADAPSVPLPDSLLGDDLTAPVPADGPAAPPTPE